MATGQLVLVLLAAGVILAGASRYTGRAGLFCAIAATVCGGVALVLELVAS